MEWHDIIGAIGVAITLLAYLMNTFNWIPKEGALFFAMNAIGSALACYASVLIAYIPFVVLEGVWCIVSIVGWVKAGKKG